MHKRTKALQPTKQAKARVYERDGGHCILCGAPGDPVAHYVSRSHGGLGIEENILTLCPICHRIYDQTEHRKIVREELRAYLQSKYPDWDENKLIYQKYGG